MEGMFAGRNAHLPGYEAYVRAYYGQVPDSREELNRIREAWRRIRAWVSP